MKYIALALTLLLTTPTLASALTLKDFFCSRCGTATTASGWAANGYKYDAYGRIVIGANGQPMYSATMRRLLSGPSMGYITGATRPNGILCHGSGCK